VIRTKELFKRFEGRSVLDGISFEVARGEILFVIGKSGTGKSVLLKTITGLLRSDAGEIWVDGQEVSRATEREFLAVRRRCGLVFQSPALLDFLTVRENIVFGLRAHRACQSEKELDERVTAALEQVGLDGHWLFHKPSELSFGMKKKVSLARTLALSPDCLLYDEPTTGLDPIATRSTNNLILKLSTAEVTSIVVSHDMESAMELADRILLLDAGKIAAEGTPSELAVNSHPLVRAFLEASGTGEFGEVNGR
jgi:phospholipid/cholesterol/gamma-HCH transport system ATP-binding protein